MAITDTQAKINDIINKSLSANESTLGDVMRNDVASGMQDILNEIVTMLVELGDLDVTKLEKGTYTGDASTLKSYLEGLISACTQKGTYSGTAGQLKAMIDSLATTGAITPDLKNYVELIKDENGVKVVQGVPVGGQKYFGTTNQTGAIKIKLPALSVGNIFNFKVKLNWGLTLLIKGYCPIGGFGNSPSGQKVILINDTTNVFPFKVYFCTGATENYILIGEVNSVWGSTRISIDEVIYENGSISADWSTGWEISLVTTLETLDSTKKVTVTPTLNSTSLEGRTWATQEMFNYSYQASNSTGSGWSVIRLSDFFLNPHTLRIRGVLKTLNFSASIDLTNLGEYDILVKSKSKSEFLHLYKGEYFIDNDQIEFRFQNDDLLICIKRVNSVGSIFNFTNLFSDEKLIISTANDVSQSIIDTYTLITVARNLIKDWTDTGEANKVIKTGTNGEILIKGNATNEFNVQNSSGTSHFKVNTINRFTDIKSYISKYKGTNVASATTIVPTGEIFHVTGTTAIATITPPTGLADCMQITIIPDGVFTTTTAGNIALATTAVVNKALIMTYDATTSKWYPSY